MASYAERGSERNGALRLTVSNHSSTSIAPSAEAATVCWARMSSGFWGTEIASICPASMRSVTTAVCSTSLRCLGKSAARLTSPTWWPARPMRCRPEAALGGDSTWITRSTAPMSMPSSRLLVATTHRSTPDFNSSSTWARCSFGHRAVVRLGEDRGDAGRRARLRHHRRGNGRVGHVDALPFGVDLVQSTRQALGQATRVGEHDRRASLEDTVDDRFFDVRPDRPAISVLSGRSENHSPSTASSGAGDPGGGGG